MSTSITPDRSSGRWLFGAWPDLLVGCGLAYVVLFAISVVVGAERLESLDLALQAVVIMTFLSIPHYGATLVRVYEDPTDRRKYAFFTVWVTLGMLVLFGVAVHVDSIAAWLNTVYLSWSPWHYSGQNYGIALMFLARAGVGVDPTAKRLLWWSFVLSFVLTLAAMHGVEASAAYAPAAEADDALSFRRLGLPPVLRDGVLLVGGVAYLGCITLAGRRLLRASGRLADLVPAASLVLIQALWFTVPVLARRFDLLTHLGPFGQDHVEYWFFWIAAGHAAQYLWIVGYYERKRVPGRSRRGFYLRALLAGFAIWTIPTLLFSPDLLGSRPYDLGLFLVLAASINLHHFIVDGAIWKLRDGPVARVLLRSEAAEPESNAPPRRRWLAPVVWALGGLSLLIGVGAYVESRFGFDAALEDARDPARMDQALARAETSLERLAWIGRDAPELRLDLARVLDRAGRTEDARRQLARSLELAPTPAAHTELGNLAARAGRWDDARAAYEAALALDEDHAEAWYHLALVEIRTGDREAGIDLLWRARDALARSSDSGVTARQIDRAIVEHGR